MSFTGTYIHTLDSKRRTTLPARFRNLIMTKDIEPTIYLRPVPEDDVIIVYTSEVIDSFTQGLDPMDSMDLSKMKVWRKQARSIIAVKVSPQGRFVIPEQVSDLIDLPKGSLLFEGAFKVFTIKSISCMENFQEVGE